MRVKKTEQIDGLETKVREKDEDIFSCINQHAEKRGNINREIKSYQLLELQVAYHRIKRQFC